MKKFISLIALSMAFALPQRIMAQQVELKQVTLSQSNYTAGDSITALCLLTNTSNETVNTVGFKVELNEQFSFDLTREVQLQPSKSQTVELQVPLADGLQEGLYKYFDVYVVQTDGKECTEEVWAGTTFNYVANTFERNVLFEEGTGTWCSWCVRGIVGMRDMKAKYDGFIGVAIHNNDPLTVDDYDASAGFISWPSVNVDRTLMRKTVSPELFEEYYLQQRANPSLAQLNLAAAWTDDSLGVDLTTNVDFGYTGSGVFNVAYILVEDSVTGYKQKNAYAGGSEGEMGGFELMDNVVDIPLDDVARGIYPSYFGEQLTETVSTTSPIQHKYHLDLPSTLQRTDHLSVVALLLDAMTGEVVNATKVILPEGKNFNQPDNPGEEDPNNPGGNGGEDSDGIHNGYTYVDLGLGVHWATGNMDSAENGFAQVSSPEMCGGYFGWADPTGLLTEPNDDLYPSTTPPEEISATNYDLARAKWGGKWRIPTHEEYVELYKNTTTEDCTLNGVAGMRFTSKINGASIFLPYNGVRHGDDMWDVGMYGSYWTSTLWNERVDDFIYAYEFDFDAYSVNVNNVCTRSEGCGIRPVFTPDAASVDMTTAGRSIVSELYYDLNGIRLQPPFSKGIIMKRTVYDNGTVQVSKMLVR